MYKFALPNFEGVDVLKAYKIPFVGLKVGSHTFTFHLTEKFFACFEHSEITQCEVDVEMIMDKRSNMMVLDFVLNGKFETMCDRCNEPMTAKLQGEEHLIVKFGDDTGTTEDDIYILGPSEYELDISQFLYEYSHLALPTRRVHEDQTICDAFIDDYLMDDDDSSDEEDNDPRWDALRGIKDE